ncbi:MAG: TAXI family TRAP transporter solute-binding subunit [Pseudomonadota bacterium]
MLRRLVSGLCALGLWAVTTSPVAALPSYNIVTASENGSHLRIGQDLARYVAPNAGMNLQALPSAGSIENLKRLRDDPSTTLALVQADVYQAYREQALKGNAEAARIVNPLRVIMPLYNDEIYFVTRADSPLWSVSDIRDQRINIGPLGSGSATTVTTLYRTMFGTPLAPDKVSTLSNEEALVRLVRDKTIDVVVVIAGQPAPLFLGMEKGAEKYFKLLELSDSPAVTAALTLYAKGTIAAESYPAWLKEDKAALSLKTLLVTYERNQADTQESLVRFAKSLCENFSVLQREGHPKWSEVSLRLPALSSGWRYYPHTAQHLRRCRPVVEAPTKRPGSNCVFQDEVLGLCPAS